MHHLREKVAASKSRVVFVSSGAVRMVSEEMIPQIEQDCKGGSGADGKKIYPETKFIALLGAQWWRRELLGKCDVVAVSPGLIPATGISRGHNLQLNHNSPDAKSPAEGNLNKI